jgi:plasmid stabilization system protein ParE
MRIRWTEPAAGDLTGIRDYINKHDEQEAARRVARVRSLSFRDVDGLVANLTHGS